MDQHKLHPAGITIGHGDTHHVGHTPGVVMVIEHLQGKQDTYNTG